MFIGNNTSLLLILTNELKDNLYKIHKYLFSHPEIKIILQNDLTIYKRLCLHKIVKRMTTKNIKLQKRRKHNMKIGNKIDFASVSETEKFGKILKIQKILFSYPEIIKILEKDMEIYKILCTYPITKQLLQKDKNIIKIFQEIKKLMYKKGIIERAVQGGLLVPNAFPNDEEFKEIEIFLKWIDDKGDSKLMYKHNLNENSIVFDVGAYIGNWTKGIYKKYKCNIFIFEPVDKFIPKIKKNLYEIYNDLKLTICQFGLGEKTYNTDIYVNDDSSSLYLEEETGIDALNIKIKDILEFVKENNISCIDLMKINIEGGEYKLLPRILENNMNVKSFLIQFHGETLYSDALELRKQITEQLINKEYKQEWEYNMIWEMWVKNENKL